VNGICSCGLRARCCQPAVAGGIIYADLRGELSTHLALQALFTQSSLVLQPVLQAFPFPSPLGEVTLHPLSQACMFVYSSCGKWVFSPLLWSFPTTVTFTSFSAPDYWAVLLLLPAAMFVYSSRGRCLFPPSCVSPLSQAFPLLVAGCVPCPHSHQSLSAGQLVYLQFQEGFPSPPFSTQCAPPSFLGVFIYLIANYSVSLFALGGGWSVQGAMLMWLRVICGSTVVPLSSPCLRLPKPSGRGRLVAQGPSWFLCLT
jgi:hypothetical protein